MTLFFLFIFVLIAEVRVMHLCDSSWTVWVALSTVQHLHFLQP